MKIIYMFNLLFKWLTKDSGIGNVSLQENAEAIIEDFSKLVEHGNQATVNRFIKFMANCIDAFLTAFYWICLLGNLQNAMKDLK